MWKRFLRGQVGRVRGTYPKLIFENVFVFENIFALENVSVFENVKFVMPIKHMTGNF